jgi:membrane protein CcdC involved in cytochrome C biogenesis
MGFTSAGALSFTKPCFIAKSHEMWEVLSLGGILAFHISVDIFASSFAYFGVRS